MIQVLSTGIIRSPHGVKGFVRVQPNSEDCGHFKKLKEVTLSKMDKTRKAEIECVQISKQQVLVKFKGIDNPEDARFISGWEILVPRNQAGRLEKNMVYTADLPGLKLVYNNEEVAEVVSVAEGPQAYLLEAKTPDGRIHMVPYLKGIFVEPADLERGTIKLLKKELVQ